MTSAAAAAAAAVPAPRTPSWRRRLSFTRLGRWYTGLTVGIGLAAINTGNNLLFLVLGLMLASIVVSGILSEQSLRGVHLERRLPSNASVGQPALIGLFARNGKRRAPSFSLELRERGGEIEGRSFIVVLPAGQAEETSYRFIARRRGVHRLRQLEVATKAPFGLFEKSRPLDADAELIVFPRRVPPPSDAPETLAREGDRPLDQVGMGFEMHSLRDHRAGEDARSIHWRSTARAGRLIGIDREQERRRRVSVVLDHRALSGPTLDRAVEKAAAIVERELDAGAEVSLALCGKRLQPGSGDGHLHSALTLLALVEPAPGAPPPQPEPMTAVIEVRG